MSQGGVEFPNQPMDVVALGRRSLTYALGGLAYKGVALLALPVLARILSPAQLGLLDLAAVLATMVGLVAVLGTDQGVAYVEPRSDGKAGVWSSALVLVSAIAGGLLLAALLFGDSLAALLTGRLDNHYIIVAAAVYGWVFALTLTALNAIRLHGSPRTYALASFAVVSAEMTAALLIAWRVASPVGLIVLSWAGAALLVTAPLLIRFVPSFDRPRAATVRRLVSFGAPLVPATVAWVIGDAWIRGVVARGLDLSALGEYGIASRIASVALLVATGFAVAWQPYMFRSPAEEVRQRAGSALPSVILGLGLLAVGLTLLAPEIVMVVAGDAYAGAADVVAALSAGAVALGVFSLLAAVTAAEGRTRRVGLAALAGVAVQFLSAPALVAVMGLPGAGVASFGGYAVALAMLATAHRELLRRGSPSIVGLVTGLVAAGLVAADLLQDWHLVLRCTLMLAVGILAAAVMDRRRLGT
ncbi:MAG: lipopolysaccharide biosynthesis protein [Candidatus Limnocylindria bacterium]